MFLFPFEIRFFYSLTCAMSIDQSSIFPDRFRQRPSFKDRIEALLEKHSIDGSRQYETSTKYGTWASTLPVPVELGRELPQRRESAALDSSEQANNIEKSSVSKTGSDGTGSRRNLYRTTSAVFGSSSLELTSPRLPLTDRQSRGADPFSPFSEELLEKKSGSFYDKQAHSESLASRSMPVGSFRSNSLHDPNGTCAQVSNMEAKQCFRVSF